MDVHVLGACATLIYLARQVRDNTKSVQSTAYGVFISSNAAVHESHMSSVGALTTYLTGEPVEWGLDSGSVDYMRFHGHATQVFFNFELAFLLHKDGTVDEEDFESRMRHLGHALQLPGLLRWWKDWANDFYDARFVRYADQRWIS